MRPEPPPPGAHRDHPIEVPLEIDTTVAQPARVQSYLAGGHAHFAVDRELGEYLSTTSPRGEDLDAAVDIGRAGTEAHLAFTARVVQYLVERAGVRQILCFGATVPMLDNVHGVAQRAAPEARVVYVGRDPVVLAHTHELRRCPSEGATAYVDGGLRRLDVVLEEAARTIDLGRPVATLLVGVLNLVRTERDAHEVVARLVKAMASGSYLVVAHPTHDFWPERSPVIAERLSDAMRRPFVLRSHAEVSRFFDGLELVEDGLVHIDEWLRPDDQPLPPARKLIGIYGGVARKP